MATVRVMSPADTPTADAKAMTLRRPASERTIEIISMTRKKEKGLTWMNESKQKGSKLKENTRQK